MKCPKCGAELTDETNFCSYCGTKINNTTSTPNDTVPKETIYIPDSAHATSEQSKISAFWKHAPAYEKFTIIVAVILLLLCLVAFLNGSIISGVFSIVQLVLTGVYFLIKKEIIHSSKRWIEILAIALVFVLLVPYFSLFGITNENTAKYDWDSIVLNEELPKPESPYGKIENNSSEALSLTVYKTSPNQFTEYIKSCEEKEFTIDSEQTADEFVSFNIDGYRLDLLYNQNNNEMKIDLTAPETYATIEWPTDGLATLLPTPKSSVGKIIRNDTGGFSVDIAEISIEDYRDYIEQCRGQGFAVEPNEEDKHFSAENDSGYQLSVEYIGFNRIHILLLEPEYQITLEVECIENLMFSTYDVEVYVDDISQDVLKHGTSATYEVTLNRGEHTVRFVSAEDETVDGEASFEVSQDDSLQFTIYCTAEQIDVENADESNDTSETQPPETTNAEETSEPEEEHLTVENCPELAAMLKNKSSNDPSFAEFAEKYAGRIIEFDGATVNCMPHGNYTTRFDYLVSAGDYDPDHMIGPAFKFEDVNYYDLNTDLETVSVGLNVYIVAEVEYFDSNSELFYLDPVSVTGR